MKRSAFCFVIVLVLFIGIIGCGGNNSVKRQMPRVLIFAENDMPELRYIKLKTKYFEGKSMPEIEYDIRKCTAKSGGDAFIITNSNHEIRPYLISNVGDPRYFNPRNFLIKKFTLTGAVVSLDEEKKIVDMKVDQWLKGKFPEGEETELEEPFASP